MAVDVRRRGELDDACSGDSAVADARVLRDGDEIRVGPVALTFSVAPTTQATETMTQTAGGIASRKSR